MSEKTARLPGETDVGAVLQTFRPTFVSAVGRAASLLFFSLLGLAWAHYTERYEGKAVPLFLLGIAGSFVYFAIAIYRCTQAFHVCERGFQFGGTSIAFDDVEKVEIRLGAPVYRYGEKQEDKDVRIHGRDGRMIHFTDLFLDHVSEKDRLIAALQPFVRGQG